MTKKRYPLNWPSITEVLSAVFKPYAGVPKAVLEKAADDGHRMHKFTSLIMRDIDVAWPLDLTPALSSMKTYKEHCIEKVLWVERYVKIPSQKTQGRADALVILKGDRLPALLDWKYYLAFSPLSRLMADLQTAAYRKGVILSCKQRPFKRMAMHVPKGDSGGWPKAIEFKDHDQAYQEFLWALRMYRRLKSA